MKRVRDKCYIVISCLLRPVYCIFHQYFAKAEPAVLRECRKGIEIIFPGPCLERIGKQVRSSSGFYHIEGLLPHLCVEIAVIGDHHGCRHPVCVAYNRILPAVKRTSFPAYVHQEFRRAFSVLLSERCHHAACNHGRIILTRISYRQIRPFSYIRIRSFHIHIQAFIKSPGMELRNPEFLPSVPENQCS